MGNLNSQYISGSNNKIEISSSKIHVKPNGDIVVGKVTKTEGTLGGFRMRVVKFQMTRVVEQVRFNIGQIIKKLHLIILHLVLQDYSLNLITLIQECLLVDLKRKEVQSFIRFEDSQLEISASTFHLSSSGELKMEADITQIKEH